MVDTIGHSDRAGVDDAQHLEALGSHRWRDPSCLTIRTWQVFGKVVERAYLEIIGKKVRLQLSLQER